MKRQFLREHHNRQEKAWKVAGNGGYYGSGGESRANGPSFHGEMQSQVIGKFMDLVQNHYTFRIQGYRFRFTDTDKTFGRANNLSPQQSRQLFQRVKNEAAQRLALLRTRLVRNRLVHGTVTGADGTATVSWWIDCDWQKTLPLARDVNK